MKYQTRLPMQASKAAVARHCVPARWPIAWIRSMRVAIRAVMALLLSLHAVQLFAQSSVSSNGLFVTTPNGYATLTADDIRVRSRAGIVRWTRTWDGQEWRFNPHWESLSHSWKNLTGSATADSGGSVAGSGGSSGAMLSSSSASGGGGGGCWVMVDEDWQPSTGTVLVGGQPYREAMVPARMTPFNRSIGENVLESQTYAPVTRVNVNYASLCAGSSLSGGSSGVQDMEAVRRLNELYVGDGGRMSFNNRSVIEKRAVQALPVIAAATGSGPLQGGRMTLAPVTVTQGYRWSDRGGDWIHYNTAGQVVAYGDRNDNTVYLQRDTAGRVRGVVDDTGQVLYTLHYSGALLAEVRDYPRADNPLDLPARSVRYEYDALNRLTKVTGVRGYATQYAYDNTHHLTRITDAEGREETLAYAGDTVTRRVAPDGGVTDYAFEFDDVNKQFISKITGPETAAGRRVEDITHNRSGKIVRQIVNGRTDQEVRYDTGARVEISTNARGFTTRTTKNEFDQLVEIAYPDGAVVKRSYSALHLRLVEEADEAGTRTGYEYDGRGNLLKKVQAVGTSDQRATLYVRNALGQTIRITHVGRTEVNGVVTPDASWQFEYDAKGVVKNATDPEGNIREYVYDRGGNLVRYTDPRGHVDRYEVDADGNLVKVTDALGHERSFAFDKVGNLLTYTNARGKAVQMAYDAMNRNTQIASPAGGIYRVQYNGQGLPTTETDEDGRQSRVEYDNFLQLVKQIDGLGNATQYGYRVSDGSTTGTLGALAMPTESRYPTFTEQQRYDERERPTTRTVLNPTALGIEGQITTIKYDKRGRTVESTNADGKTSYFGYDVLGRSIRFTNSLGKSVEFTWDVRGNLIQVKDYNGNTTQFEYDRVNRLVKEIAPLGQVTSITYDTKGNRETVTDAEGHGVRYVYDAADRLIRTETTAAGEATVGLAYTFTHDEEGNLTGWSDGTRSATYTYDDDGRRLNETLHYGAGISLAYAYAYTAAGYTQSLQYPDGITVSYVHDAHGGLSQIDIPGEGSISVNAWNWMAPQKITLPGGTTRELTHDGLLKLTGLKVKNPGQQTVLDLFNKYGKLEELKEKSISDANGASSSTINTEYAYDTEQRLTRVVRDAGGVLGTTTETFGVDASGNRISHSAVSGVWTYDSNNRLIQRGDVSFQYDANGNLIRRTVGVSGAASTITLFRYDVLNRLVEVRAGDGVTLAKYIYDPFDNRIVKELHRDATGAILATPQRTHYLYSEEGLIAEADGTGTVTTQYGWKPDGEWGTDPVFIKTTLASNGGSATGYAYLHNDHIGTPLRATDKAGNVVWRADYSSNGQATPAADNALTINLRLAGQYFDAETGLHYNTRRYYDPQTGRYITADPVGFAGGWNLYEYANSDPINQVDPTGEWVWVVIRVAMTVYDIYTTYQEITEQGECFDWTRLIPIPIKIPKIKWLTKRFKKCVNPCDCMPGGGGRHSFPADTLVHAQDEHGNAALKPIASLQPGDRVLAKSEWKAEAESLSYEPVTDVFTTPSQRRTLVHLTLGSGETITTTDGHPFKTADGWRDAIMLKKGGKLLLKGSDDDSHNDREVDIVDVRHTSETLTTYNLEVGNAHTFFVGTEGALVHNIGRSTKRKLRDNNVKDHGFLKCVVCGAECVIPKRHTTGVTPPNNEAHAGHQKSRANGGSDDLDNLEVECRLCNLTNGKKNR